MKRRFVMCAALTMMALISAGLVAPTAARTEGATQISGIAYFAAAGECTTDPEGQGASYALTMTGSLSGCHYVFIETSRCLESGAYYESGTETFVGNYNGQAGTFTTNYVFTAKYANCSTFTGGTAGRCQHPFQDGSGTGVFAGIKEARIDMKDDVEVGNFPYRGHVLF